MALNETFVDTQGTRFDIVATQAGRVGIDLSVLETGMLRQTFHVASAKELLLVLGALAAAGAYIGWIGPETETALATALVAEARRLGRTDAGAPTPPD